MSATAPASTLVIPTPVHAPIDWSTRPRTVQWIGGLTPKAHLLLLDQRLLPHEFKNVEHYTLEHVIESIRDMLVRGAPAIGASGAYGMVIAAKNSFEIIKSSQEQDELKRFETLFQDLTKAKEQLDNSRPTAINLMWATARILSLFNEFRSAKIYSVDIILPIILAEAEHIATTDIQINKRIGDFGATLLPEKSRVIHHCNTGAFATVDYGTALGVIYSAHYSKRGIEVYVDETRPRLQGAKLTTLELQRAGVPFHLQCDSAAAYLMSYKKVDACLIGADRVSANGDVANKIGSFQLAIVAKYHNVPFFACVPTSTIDLTRATGKDIPIELRSSTEITHVDNTPVAPASISTFNPAFDVVPNSLVTAIITEEGICYPPFEVSLKEAKDRAENRLAEEWKDRVSKLSQSS